MIVRGSMMPSTSDSPIPSQHDQLLLKALVADGPQAIRAATDWLDFTDVDILNEGVRRLVPMLRYRMQLWGLEHPSLPAIHRVYRVLWLQDQRLRYQGGIVLHALTPLNIPITILKGFLLGRLYYPNTACRPAADMDLLIEPDQHAPVIATLEGLGYEAHPIASFHAWCFKHPDGAELDLHRSPYHEAYAEDLTRPIFGRRVKLDWPEGPNLYRLGSGDQLLHTISHGLRKNTVLPIRWILDAVYQLRNQGEAMEWNIFLAEASRLELDEVARRGLEVIDQVAPGLVPAEVTGRLRAKRTSETERRYRLERELGGPLALWFSLRRNTSILQRVIIISSLFFRMWRIRGNQWFISRLRFRTLELLGFKNHVSTQGTS
jgi:hypothetical protein